jgi:hypothetical protein
MLRDSRSPIVKLMADSPKIGTFTIAAIESIGANQAGSFNKTAAVKREPLTKIKPTNQPCSQELKGLSNFFWLNLLLWCQTHNFKSLPVTAPSDALFA